MDPQIGHQYAERYREALTVANGTAGFKENAGVRFNGRDYVIGKVDSARGRIVLRLREEPFSLWKRLAELAGCLSVERKERDEFEKILGHLFVCRSYKAYYLCLAETNNEHIGTQRLDLYRGLGKLCAVSEALCVHNKLAAMLRRIMCAFLDPYPLHCSGIREFTAAIRTLRKCVEQLTQSGDDEKALSEDLIENLHHSLRKLRHYIVDAKKYRWGFGMLGTGSVLAILGAGSETLSRLLSVSERSRDDVAAATSLLVGGLGLLIVGYGINMIQTRDSQMSYVGGAYGRDVFGALKDLVDQEGKRSNRRTRTLLFGKLREHIELSSFRRDQEFGSISAYPTTLDWASAKGGPDSNIIEKGPSQSGGGASRLSGSQIGNEPLTVVPDSIVDERVERRFSGNRQSEETLLLFGVKRRKARSGSPTQRNTFDPQDESEISKSQFKKMHVKIGGSRSFANVEVSRGNRSSSELRRRIPDTDNV